MNEESFQNIKTTDDLNVWLKNKPYWEQYLWQTHMTKEKIDDSDIEACYNLLLEDCNVIKANLERKNITFSALDFNGTEKPKTKTIIDKIDHLENINALDKECIVEFGKNLTIIYGDNGAGKSGIGRLLSNACYSRKPRKLLPNAKTSIHPTDLKAKADFYITDDSGTKVIKYTIDEIYDALKSFSVFDHECSVIHLNSENIVEFVPLKIHIFDEIFKSISAIEAKLQKEIGLKRKENPTENIFSNNSKIKEFIDALSGDTTEEEINIALEFTESDKKLLTEKQSTREEKQKQDISKQKKELTDECNDLNNFKNKLISKSTVLSLAREEKINILIKEIKEKREITKKISIHSFEFPSFTNIGSPEWRSLIMAAKILYDKEIVSSETIELEYCLLCRQTLTSKEKTLFEDYWKFLKSTAEIELLEARRKLKLALDTLSSEIIDWPTFSDAEIAVKIVQKDSPVELAKIKSAFNNFHIQIIKWIDNIKNENPVVFVDPKIDITTIIALIDTKKEVEKKLVDTTLEIKKLDEEIINLNHKQRASGIISKIKDYVLWLRWQKAVSMINLSNSKRNTTRKKTEIMDKLVISKYVEIFNEETEKLKCNFGLIVESHGREVQIVKGLKLNFAPGYNPSDILSEGEQTVSALADFLTEAKLDNNNSGIIFDDPVNSLDHLRKNIIAENLAEEAKERQVIILTHDLSFLFYLQTYAEKNSIPHVAVSIRKNGDKVGVIKQELPWLALKVKSKVGYLRNELPKIKKIEGDDQEKYRKEVKSWYELLREAWERAVEERLFNGVVQRFSPAIQTQRLNKLKITPELISEVDAGMTESSNWLHDMSTGINPIIPDNKKLEESLNLLENFITKCPPE